jgi:hypothetical protein
MRETLISEAAQYFSKRTQWCSGRTIIGLRGIGSLAFGDDVQARANKTAYQSNEWYDGRTGDDAGRTLSELHLLMPMNKL